MDILQHIKSRGMTVAGAARVAGVSRQAIYDIAKPDHDPSVKTVIAVARAIGVAPQDIRPELGK